MLAERRVLHGVSHFAAGPLPVPSLCLLVLRPICAAEQHQRRGSNPRGSPNPGDYPASLPPLLGVQHCFVFRSSY